MAQAISRDYEVSIWTLQDEFISVLKPTGVVNKGQIESPTMRLVDDGTQEFHFSIPMYIFLNGKRVFNPIWKNVQNGNVIADMRKIKVTFNRERGEQKTFEFLITDVTERHETDQLYCDVNCEGMAFHELGKRGYKINLLSEDFILENNDYFDRTLNSTGGLKVPIQPKATLSYWLDKFLPRKPIRQQDCDARTWYYDIRMDWSSYANGSQRKRDEVYEEEFVSSWNLEKDENNNDVYVSGTTESAKIKERLVDLKESNIYNLTQDLAENFGVYCRYEYEHDENLEIIGRTIVFYNNYMKENEGYIDITYPYETKAVTRVRDSKELTTKMFVTSVEDPNSESGVLTIMDVPANKSREDYILNFDYLYKIGGITEEQHKAIEIYEAEIGKLNRELASVGAPLNSLYNQKTELEAEQTIHKASWDQSSEGLGQADDKLNAITDGDGTVEKTRPDCIPISLAVTADDSRYVTFSQEGIVPETVHIWAAYDANNDFSDDPPTKYLELVGNFEYEEKTGNLYKISNLAPKDGWPNKPNSSPARKCTWSDLVKTVVCMKWSPMEYWNKVKQTMSARMGMDDVALKNIAVKLDTVNTKIKDIEKQQEKLLKNKQKLVKDFENMMGAALRESYWQPDEYNDYGDNYLDQNLGFTTSTTSTTVGDSGYTQTIWDSTLFTDEEDGYYEEGIEQTQIYYPVIKISDTNLTNIVQPNYDKLSVVFYDTTSNSSSARQPQYYRVFPLGSMAQYAFAYDPNQKKIIPVIVLTGAGSLVCCQEKDGDAWKDDDDTGKDAVNSLKRLFTNGTARVGVLETKYIDKTKPPVVSLKTSWTPEWLNYQQNAFRYTKPVTLYYPRIKIGSMSMKTAEDQLGLKYNGNSLTIYEDYYLLSRDDSTWTTDANPVLETADSAYYITIKPEIMMRYGTYTGKVEFKFCISNANIAIYLDAIQVLKENSQPKVSYTVDASFVNTDFIYDLYNKLNRICNINDTELQFENVQGYISSIDIDCDIPSNDKIEVKNYKTKFEDLFSSIVAQTQAMKKSEYAIGLAAGSFTSDGDLTEKAAESVWRRVDLNLAFNKGKLTINDKDGIWGTSDDGVVAFRGGGIFTATKKDDAGNWIWNTGIIPQGINADLITTGQLDTNKINIFSGDNIRFSWNPDGIFAYRDFYNVDTAYGSIVDTNTIKNYILSNGTEDDIKALENNKGVDAKQFVTLNQEGLFLVMRPGAYYMEKVYNSNGVVSSQSVAKYTGITNLNRLSVSWDGFMIKGVDNKPVFFASPSGELMVKGKIYAHGLYITDDTHTDAPVTDYISQVVQKGVYYGPEPSTSNNGDIWYDSSSNYNKVKVEGHWVPFSYMGGTFLSVNTNTGIIQLNGSNNVQITATNNASLACGANLYLYGGKSVNIMTGDNVSSPGVSQIILNRTDGIRLSSNAKIALSTGATSVTTNSFLLDSTGITMNAGSITMNSADFQVRTRVAMGGSDLTFTALQIDDNGIYATNLDTSTFLGKEGFSIFKGVYVDSAVNIIFSANESGVSATNLEVDNLEISGTLSLNGVPFVTADDADNQNCFSNKKIIYADSQPPNEHDVIWLEPQGSDPPVPTTATVTLKSNTIDNREGISSGPHTSEALTFSNYSSIATGDSYTYTATIKVYGTGSGSRTIKKTTSTLKYNSNIILTLKEKVVITPGSEKTLTFTGTSSNKPGTDSTSWTITLDSDTSDAYVNLQRNTRNKLQITSSGGSSTQGVSKRACNVWYIP